MYNDKELKAIKSLILKLLSMVVQNAFREGLHDVAFCISWKNFVEHGEKVDFARNVHLFKGMDVFICVIECSVGCKMIS